MSTITSVPTEIQLDAAVITSIGIIAVFCLVVCLVLQVITAEIDGSWVRMLTRRLNIVVTPLLIVLSAIVINELARVI
ncbi:MAG: hypothetical protein SVY53_01955 [Chloroflexota bacterium]|nr:hypothetical protein [Chloroflexota bacterium]